MRAHTQLMISRAGTASPPYPMPLRPQPHDLRKPRHLWGASMRTCWAARVPKPCTSDTTEMPPGAASALHTGPSSASASAGREDRQAKPARAGERGWYEHEASQSVQTHACLMFHRVRVAPVRVSPPPRVSRRPRSSGARSARAAQTREARCRGARRAERASCARSSAGDLRAARAISACRAL